MFKRLFQSPRSRRSEQIAHVLTEHAVRPITAPSFEDQSAFVRAYAVALGIFIPQYTVAAAFPEKVYPPWDDVVWRKTDDVFLDLAATLAWRACLAAFNDLSETFEAEDVEPARQTLMGVCGTVFSPSDRAERLMRQYDTFERDVESRQIFLEHGFVLVDGYLPNMKHLEIHAWMVNEILGEPPLSNRDGDPAHIFGLSMYLAQLETNFVRAFKARALDLMRRHIAAGKP